MAVSRIITDGFDFTGTTLAPMWAGTQQNTSTTTPFGLGRSLTPAGSAVHYAPLGDDYAAAIIHFNHRTGSSLLTTNFLQVSDDTTEKISARFNGSGQIEIRQGTDVLVTGPVFQTEKWYNIVIAVLISETVGTVHLWVNDKLSGSGDTLDTAGSATETANRVYPVTSGTGSLFDDFVVWAGDSYHAVNDAKKPMRWIPLNPSGAGVSAQWTASAGANHDAAGEAVQDGDTTYVHSDTADDLDLYAMGDLPYEPPVIHGVDVVVTARVETTGVSSIKPVVRSGTTNFEGATKDLDDVYETHVHMWDEDPNASAAWTPAAVNAIQAGVKLESFA